ncbi:hypothetical protein PPERSA_04960 [Pseudocohnilembus persalinus]|uniref:Serine/threonine-protein phosphatase n=1 Tax=Pseudocohnilembus persalinus TaxID=266149 RepID=A0A0V0QVU0_PSEPJ|nr:hypothetical protein PPERSA_04960 [Pseudocohnilembus persalinus]|eukprot:KRX06347.1 hypothetical protein PPERSA_04960 [Pseudocohnilembus persalinus]
MVDLHNCLSKLKTKSEILTEKEIKEICKLAIEIMSNESNLQPVATPVNVCGDIHGQFFDLLELFKKGGEIPDNNYIFIGDFVDRGYNSVETIEYLFCLKVLYPSKITLLRGNHESRQTTQAYGFYDEVLRKYGNINVWKYVCNVFDYLPLGALIDSKKLCIHGGLSPQIKTLDQIRTIERNREIPLEGPFTDLLWSDPEDIETWAPSSRGAGYLFGHKVVSEFNEINGLDLICRAHQLAEEGYHYWFKEKNLITVWSAPNYCYRMGNKACIFKIHSNDEKQIIFFEEDPESSKQPAPRKVLPYFL